MNVDLFRIDIIDASAKVSVYSSESLVNLLNWIEVIYFKMRKLSKTPYLLMDEAY